MDKSTGLDAVSSVNIDMFGVEITIKSRRRAPATSPNNTPTEERRLRGAAAKERRRRDAGEAANLSDLQAFLFLWDKLREDSDETVRSMLYQLGGNVAVSDACPASPFLTQAASGQGVAPIILDGRFTKSIEMPTDEPVGTPHIILAPRIKKTKQTADKTTFRKTLEEAVESMATMTDKVEVVNKESIKTRLDDDTISKLAQAIKKDRKHDTADGIQEGLLKAEALSQPSRQAKIREMQEDMLSQQGHKPVDIARLHNPEAKDNVIRKAAQKISNDQNRRKKKKSK